MPGLPGGTEELLCFVLCRELRWNWSQDTNNLFKKIYAVIQQDVGKVIHSLYVEAKHNGQVPIHFDRSLFSLQEKIELINPEVNQFYDFLRKSPAYYFGDGHIQATSNDYVLENVKDLLQSKVNSDVGLKKLINTLERRLSFLRNSLRFSAKLSIREETHLSYFHVEVQDVAVNGASFLFSCWINKMDENKEPVRERDDLSVALNYGSNWEETSSEIPPKDQVESLHEELMFVKTLLRTTPMQYIDDENSHQKHIGAQVNKVARLIEDLYVGNLNEEMITMKNSVLVRLLGRLKFINLTSIVEQVNHETGMVVSMRDQFETLCFDMRLLRAFLIDTQRDYTVDKKFDNIQSHIEAVGLKAGSSIYSFYTKEIKGGMAEEMSHLQPEFLEKINLIKANICKILPGATSTNFWKISGQRGMTILLKELNKPLYSRADTISRFVKPHVEKAARLWTENFQNGLKFLISFLENFDEQCIEIRELKTLEECIMNMANGAKYATDPIFLRENPFWHCMLKLYDVMEEVKLIKKEINRINENFSGEKLSAMSEVVVGFEDEAKNIIDN